ncbi:hypothetical protein NOVO_02035 [Rickettsiales bacterium Ac37b]|nr:hypothetical protein NOVO_02035 [Rickettsiales bacterium Ac37b]
MENQLTIYHDTGHAFIKLECSDCSNSKPASFYVGLYPADENPTDDISYDDEKNSGFFRYVEPFMPFIPFTQSSIGSSLYSSGHPYSSYAKTGKSLAEFSIFGYLFIKDSHSIKNYDRYEIINELRDPFSNNPLYFSSTFGGYSFEELMDMESKIFNISKEQASKIFSRVAHLTNTCDKDYAYKLLGNNCVDFVQEMYNLAGLEGDHFDQMYPSQYSPTMLGLYHILCKSYDFFSDLLN